ncbi:MAG: hypothetical protein Tsb0010_12920 [Parvularculaceae bacterium]
MSEPTVSNNEFDDLFDLNDDDLAAPARQDGGGLEKFEGKRALVVDDNLVNLEIAAEALELEDFIVDNAAGGKEAIELVNERSYDLILLDLFMPEINGLAVGEAIRASANNSGAKIVIFSAGDKAHIKNAVDVLKADGVVTKPVDIDNLLATVNNALQ